MIIMNRNTCPLKPLSNEQIIKVVQNTDYNQYPDQERQRFINIYAKAYDLNPSEIEVANGSDEWIQKAVMTLGQNGVMAFNPDFVMYKIYTEQVLPELLTVDCEPDFSFDFAKAVQAIQERKPSLFMISNPHNPTGVMFKTEELQLLADTMAEVDGYLVLDECYIDFAVDYERPQGQNIVFLRTLSKLYGMAGLRIGLAIAQGETFTKINSINHPYTLNSLSLNLASELFSNKEKLAEFKNYQFESKKQLTKALAQVNDLITIKPSLANYIFTFGDLAVDLAEFLISKGFLPRTYDTPILKNAARYSIIKLDDYPALNQAIMEWKQKY
ncbi:MAG TPA: histidinol-phosphate aminotransferase family protein [Clostridiaceae bacterium]|nr:histidinol-phosphate aminotransferase family protein [Clostridiaceae bacterium]